MQKRLARRVERLEVAKFAVDLPHVAVIHLDEHGRLTRSAPTRPDGLPIPVIILPTLRSPALEDFQIMATPEELRQRGQQ
jgi:hypothetical protein